MKPNVVPQPAFRVLIIQLGDGAEMMQSLMALRAAKQLYPQVEVEIVVAEGRRDAVARVPWITRVTELPRQKLLDSAPSLTEATEWIKPWAEKPVDLLVNWSFSPVSSYLTHLVAARIKLGYSRRADGTLACPDGWSHYVQAVVHGGVRQNIHMTDILTTQLLTALQIHLGDPLPEESAGSVTSRSFFSLQVNAAELANIWPGFRDSARKWIALHLGDGTQGEFWERVSQLILERHPECAIAFMGNPAAKALGDRLAAKLGGRAGRGGRVACVVGPFAAMTEFDAVTAVMSRVQWVIGADPSAVHLASVLGTRVLQLADRAGEWQSTGPYGNGHYVVYPENGPDELAPEAVYATWAYSSSEWMHRRQHPIAKHFARLGWTDKLASTQIFRSKIRTTQDGGGVVFEPMIEAPLTLEDWNSQVIGHVARAWYCGWTPPIGQELVRERMSPTLTQALRGLDEAAQILARICDEARGTATHLQRHTSALRSEKIMRLADREEVARLGRKLEELDTLVSRLANAQGPLRAFSTMSKVLMHNLRGSKIAELGLETSEAYGQLAQGVALVRDWIKHTLVLARPIALPVAAGAALEARGTPTKPPRLEVIE